MSTLAPGSSPVAQTHEGVCAEDCSRCTQNITLCLGQKRSWVCTCMCNSAPMSLWGSSVGSGRSDERESSSDIPTPQERNTTMYISCLFVGHVKATTHWDRGCQQEEVISTFSAHPIKHDHALTPMPFDAPSSMCWLQYGSCIAALVTRPATRPRSLHVNQAHAFSMPSSRRPTNQCGHNQINHQSINAAAQPLQM